MKIIIGSLLGFLASAVGLVAVFFPDLFNLEKEKITEVKMVIENFEDTKKFRSLIDDVFEKKKITHLDVKFKLGNYTQTYEDNVYSDLYEFTDPCIAPIKFSNVNSSFPEMAVTRGACDNPKEIKDYLRSEIISSGNISSGLVYRFLNNDIEDWEQRYNYKNSALEGICIEGMCDNFKLLGYFIPTNAVLDEMDGEREAKEFIKVPDHIVKLKDY